MDKILKVNLPFGHVMTQGNFIEVVEGLEPPKVVLTVPHDQAYWAPSLDLMFKRRKKGRNLRDRRTGVVANHIALGSQNVCVVRGLFPRAFVDYNRALSDSTDSALADPNLLPVYNAYHQEIERFVGMGRKAYGNGYPLLLDIHGFKNQPSYAPESGFDIIFGTRYRKTISSGYPDLDLAQALEGVGFKVFVPGKTSVVEGEDDLFPGNYTVEHYSRKYGISAIQIELRFPLRKREVLRNGPGKLEEVILTWINNF